MSERLGGECRMRRCFCEVVLLLVCRPSRFGFNCNGIGGSGPRLNDALK